MLYFIGMGVCCMAVVTFFALMPWRQETRDEEAQ
jgi:hypothetical protein